MVAEVPVGALLSGRHRFQPDRGPDAAPRGVPVRTFTVSFEEEAFDEAASAAAVAAHLGTEHTTVDMPAQRRVRPRPPAARHLGRAVLRQLAASHPPGGRGGPAAVTVALSGDGGDELFAGYNRHAWLDRVWRCRATPSRLRSDVVSGVTSASHPAGSRRLGGRPAPGTLAGSPALDEGGQTGPGAPGLERRGGLPSARLALGGSGLTGTAARAPDAGRHAVTATPSLGRRRRRDGPAAADRSGHLPSRRHPDQGRPGGHGRVPRDARRRSSTAACSRQLGGFRRPRSAATARPSGCCARSSIATCRAALVDRPEDGLRGAHRQTGCVARSGPGPRISSPDALRRHGLLDPDRSAGPGSSTPSRRDLSAELWDVLMLQAWLDRWSPRSA